MQAGVPTVLLHSTDNVLFANGHHSVARVIVCCDFKDTIVLHV